LSATQTVIFSPSDAAIESKKMTRFKEIK